MKWLFLALALSPLLQAGSPGDRVQYVGGTVAELSGKPSGRIQITDPKAFLFESHGVTVRVLFSNITNLEYETKLRSVSGLLEVVNEFQKGQEPATKLLLMEFALHGLAEYSQISKHNLERGLQFKDLISGMFNLPKGESEEENESDEDE